MKLLEERIGSAVAIKNILFATDFSEVSEAGLPYVTALSLRYGSKVHVVHVLPESTLVRPSPVDPALLGSIYEQAHSDAQEKIQQLSNRLRGFPHETYIRHGKVSDVLSQIIQELEIDLLVLGTHGRTGLGKLVMGSIAEEIFRQAPGPVLTVGPRVSTIERIIETRHDHSLPPAQIRFHQILYATDFRSGSAKALSYAASMAQEFQARLTLLHIIEDYGDHLHERPGPIDIALQKLEALVPVDTGLRYRPELVAEFGIPNELILQTATECDADLIVLGLQSAVRHIGASTHFGNSTAHKVVAGANCPVLTVRS